MVYSPLRLSAEMLRHKSCLETRFAQLFPVLIGLVVAEHFFDL